MESNNNDSAMENQQNEHEIKYGEVQDEHNMHVENDVQKAYEYNRIENSNVQDEVDQEKMTENNYTNDEQRNDSEHKEEQHVESGYNEVELREKRVESRSENMHEDQQKSQHLHGEKQVESADPQEVSYALAPEYGAYIPRKQHQYGESYVTVQQNGAQDNAIGGINTSATSMNNQNVTNSSQENNVGRSTGEYNNVPQQLVDGQQTHNGNAENQQNNYHYNANKGNEEHHSMQQHPTQELYQDDSVQRVPEKHRFENPYEVESSHYETLEHKENAQNTSNYSPFAGSNNANNDNIPTYVQHYDLQTSERKMLKQIRKASIVSAVVSSIVTLLVIFLFGYTLFEAGFIGTPSSQYASGSLNTVPTKSQKTGTVKIEGTGAPDWKNVVKQVSGSVVSIQTDTVNGIAKGSGLIIDADGHVVTNNHVIEGAKSILVTTIDGQISAAAIVGVDRSTDLAVIKLNKVSQAAKVGEFADSDNLAVGQPIMAIGNPLGYDDTATVGIVSAINRPVAVMDKQQKTQIVTNAVQIDASINPGNSGGPTFDAAGKVIGINSSIVSTAREQSQAGSIGIGFAIPSNLVKRIASEILQHGSAQHVLLGATITGATVQVEGITRSGAQIVQTPSGNAIVPGSPADKAGLRSGDTIIGFNKLEVTSSYSLLGFVRAAALGDRAILTVVRNNHIISIPVTFDLKESSVIHQNTLPQNNNNGNGNDNKKNQQNNGDDNDDDGLFDPFGMW